MCGKNGGKMENGAQSIDNCNSSLTGNIKHSLTLSGKEGEKGISKGEISSSHSKCGKKRPRPREESAVEKIYPKGSKLIVDMIVPRRLRTLHHEIVVLLNYY